MNKTKKKILFIITGLVGGGAEKALVNLLNSLDYTLCEVELFVIFADKSSLKDLSNITIYTLFSSAKSLLYKIAKHVYVDLRIKILLQYLTRKKIKKHYDTIISFLEGDSLLYHSFLFERAKNNVSWVHTDFVENHWSKRHFIKTDERNTYLSLNKVVFVSEYAKQQFAKVFPLPERIHQYVCANIINVEEIVSKSRAAIDIQKKKFTICSVGRLEEVKGYDMVIAAARMLKNRNVDVDFWILGTGSQEKKLKEQLAQSQCEDMVHFLGYQSNPYPYMRAADIYLISSYAEGLPLVLYEALCLGKPIIATRTIGALEILKTDINSKIIEISADAIANNVEKFLLEQVRLRHFDKTSLQYESKRILQQLYQEIF